MPFIGNQPALSYTSFAKQDFTTSATTSYTLDNPVTNENEIALFINFVRQEPTTAYTASGTSLTLTSATSASDDMYCVFLGKAVQTVNPPNGSVGLSQLSATGTKDSTTFLRGDNTFAVAGGTNTPAFHATASGSQVITNNTFTKLQFGNEVFDTNSNYDTSNYRFLPTTAGKYYFKAVARSTDTTNFSTIWMQISKNGSVVSRVIQPHDDYSSVEATIIVSMNGSSDYLEAFFRHNKGSDLTLENQTYSCYSEGFKIIE